MRPGKYTLLCVVLGLLALGLSTSGAVELTLDNYAELTAGKGCFIKYFTGWCGPLNLNVAKVSSPSIY
jgi:hypothetical protein